jgi:hypothetical protein
MSQNRTAPLSGIAFVVFFIASVAVSSPPKSSASDGDWLRAYATHSKQVGHLATGILLVLAGLSLMVFLTHLWTRVVEARQPERISPLPLIAAGVAAACMGVGGILMGSISGSALTGSAPIPDAGLLRFTNDAGFAMVGIAGMLAASVSIACLSVQARAAGLFGARMFRFSLLVAVVLLAAAVFIPIVALLIWLVVVAVSLRRSAAESPGGSEALTTRETVGAHT